MMSSTWLIRTRNRTQPGRAHQAFFAPRHHVSGNPLHAGQGTVRILPLDEHAVAIRRLSGLERQLRLVHSRDRGSRHVASYLARHLCRGAEQDVPATAG